MTCPSKDICPRLTEHRLEIYEKMVTRLEKEIIGQAETIQDLEGQIEQLLAIIRSINKGEAY